MTEKSFIGYGPARSALPVRPAEKEALVSRGRASLVLRQAFGLAAGLAGGWAVLYGQLCPFGLALVLGLVLRRSPEEKPGPGRLVLTACGAAALGAVNLGTVNLGLAAAAFCTLVLACRGKIQPALSSSAVAAAALCCADSALACGAVGLCCGTALGLLAQGDRLICTALYGAGTLAGVLAVQPPGDAFGHLAALGAGAVCCLLLPRRLLMRDASLAHDPAERAERPQLSAAATRLNAAAESLSSLADTVNKVYEGLPRRQEGYRWVIDNTHDALCAKCGRQESCWKEEYAVTMAGFEALRPILEEKQQVEAQDLPGQLARCIHPAALSGTLTRSFALYKSRQEARVHAEAMRTALTEQYSAVAQALSALGDQIGSPGSTSRAGWPPSSPPSGCRRWSAPSPWTIWAGSGRL